MTQPRRPRRETYGFGFISQERGRFRVIVPRRGTSRFTVGIFDDPDEATRVLNAYNLQRVELEHDPRTTLRQWGEAYLESIKDQRSIGSTTDTWNSVVGDAPFIDDPLVELSPMQIGTWAETQLPRVRVKRSVLKNGKRTLVQLDRTISRTYQVQALGHLKRALDKAVARGLIPSNPADKVDVPKDYAQAHDPRLDYLTATDLDLLLGCEACALQRTTTLGDADMLAACPHMPFEVRVPLTLATHQAPREGELAGMDWDHVDWDNREWWVARSWDGPTKNGKVRPQALLPRSFRMLHKWWELCGRPTHGIIFPSTKGKKPFGARAKFVHALDDESERRLAPAEVVDLAHARGLRLTSHHVDVIRSKRREAASRCERRFTKGYDWGFQDHPETGRDRPGWWRKVGIAHRVRFHDLRDTAATHLLSGTWGDAWTMERVSKFLGHSSVKVTEQRYAHLTREAARAEVLGLESDRGPRLRHSESDSPHIVRSAKISNALTMEIDWAPEVGLEPTTTRLTGFTSPRETNDLARMRTMFGLSAPVYDETTVLLARRLLMRIEAGEALRGRDLSRLANAALQHPQAALALAVLDDGPNALAQATELAQAIIATSEARKLLSG